MDELTGAAPAAAEPISAPEPTFEAPVSPPNPVHSEPTPEPVKVEAKEPEAKKAPSIDEALDRATKKVESEAKAEKPTDKAEPVTADAKPEIKRDETGKFAPKEGDKPTEKAPVAEAEQPKPEAAPKPATQHSEAPSRFSPDAKAAWEAAPEPVKAEVNRAIRELEQGHQKYKADAEAFESVKPFADRAKQGGTDLPTALTKYVGMEDALRANPIAGLEQVMQNLNLRASDGRVLTLRDVAAHIMGQSPDQVQQGHDQTIAQLNAKIAELEQKVGGVTKTFEERRSQAVLGQVESFAKEHPRFEELSDTITTLITKGMTADLSEAYAMAEKLNPASAPIPVASSAPEAAIPEAQTLKGTKSVSGAPTPGSNPALRKVSQSIDESLERAFARAG